MALLRWRLERPRSLGPSPVGKRPLVAMTTRSRISGDCFANQRPMIDSDSVLLYTSAVSTNVPPTSRKRSSWAWLPASSVSEPNVIVPRASTDTEQPLAPNVR